MNRIEVPDFIGLVQCHLEKQRTPYLVDPIEHPDISNAFDLVPELLTLEKYINDELFDSVIWHLVELK